MPRRSGSVTLNRLQCDKQTKLRCCQLRWGSAVVHLAYNTFQQCHRYEHYRQCDRHRRYVSPCLQTVTLCLRIHTSIHAVSFQQCHLQVAILVLWFHSNSPFLTIQFFRENHEKIIRSPYLIPSIGSPHLPNSSWYQKQEMGCGSNHAEPDVQKFLFGFNSQVQIFKSTRLRLHMPSVPSSGISDASQWPIRLRQPAVTAYELLRRAWSNVTRRFRENKTHASSSWM